MAVITRKTGSIGARLRQPSARWLLLAHLLTWALVFVAAGLVFQATLTWGQDRLNDLRYGNPRMAQISGYVGHGNERRMPTQIITLNLDGQVSTLVLPGGDATTVQVLPGPYIIGHDGPQAVALPELRDMNGDGHVDLLVTVRNEMVVYLNENGRFELVTPEEQEVLQEGME